MWLSVSARAELAASAARGNYFVPDASLRHRRCHGNLPDAASAVFSAFTADAPVGAL